MKKIFRLLIALVLTLFLVSCDGLEQTPKLQITYHHGYNNIKDVKTYVQGEVIPKRADLERDHYEFLGWFTKDNDKYGFDKIETNNFELFGKWDVITYEVEYMNTQNQPHDNITTYTIEDDEFTLQPLGDLEFQTFIGWYDSLEGGNEVTTIGGNNYSNLTIYARWEVEEEVEIVNVELNLNEGTSDTYTLLYNASIDELDAPKRLGYIFISFYFDENYNEEIPGDYLFKKDITIYALYEKIEDGKEVLVKEFYLEDYNLVYAVQGYEFLYLIIDETRYEIYNSEEDIYINLDEYKDLLIDEQIVELMAIGFDGAISSESLLVRYYPRQDDVVFYTTDFNRETDTKGGYAPAIIEVEEIDWMFDDALLGLLDNDKRVDNIGRSVRMRNEGFIELQGKFSNFDKLEFLAASYGDHKPANIHVWIKVDGGDYIEVHTAETTPDLELVEVTAEMLTNKGIDIEGEVQLKISKSGGNSVNIDNLRIYVYENAFYRSRLNIDYNYSGYYEGIDGLKGEQLFLKLREIVSEDLLDVRYNDVREILEVSDMDPDNENNVLTIYDRQSVKGKWDGNTYHREHVWPNSRLGIPRVGPREVNIGSDPHNLRAIIPSVNSSRSNRYFVDSNNPYNHTITGGDAYFPGDADKGDVARILMFMVVRYEWLSLTSTPSSNKDNINYDPAGAAMGDLSILLEWHLDDPVDDFEARRNDVIYSYQNNRNPFIDHEELFEEIHNYLTELDGIKAKIASFKYLTIEISKNSFIKDDEDEYTVIFST